MSEPDPIAKLTHHFALVVSSYEDAYNERCALVAEHLQGPDADHPHLLADKLREWARDRLCGPLYEGPIVGSSEAGTVLVRELVGVSLAFVDWSQLAADYIEEAQ